MPAFASSSVSAPQPQSKSRNVTARDLGLGFGTEGASLAGLDCNPYCGGAVRSDGTSPFRSPCPHAFAACSACGRDPCSSGLHADTAAHKCENLHSSTPSQSDKPAEGRKVAGPGNGSSMLRARVVTQQSSGANFTG
jgi:hypothetical protein